MSHSAGRSGVLTRSQSRENSPEPFVPEIQPRNGSVTRSQSRAVPTACQRTASVVLVSIERHSPVTRSRRRENSPEFQQVPSHGSSTPSRDGPVTRSQSREDSLEFMHGNPTVGTSRRSTSAVIGSQNNQMERNSPDAAASSSHSNTNATRSGVVTRSQSRGLSLSEASAVDPNILPRNLKVNLSNVVIGVHLNCRFEHIARSARNTAYHPKQFSGCVIRIREPKATALVFATGKMEVLGTRTVEDARLAARKFARIFQKLGYQPKMTDFAIHNMVGNVDTGMVIRLEGIRAKHYLFSSYEPENFPGLSYRMMDPKVTCLIFVKGKVVIVGAKKREDLDVAIEKLWPALVEFRRA